MQAIVGFSKHADFCRAHISQFQTVPGMLRGVNPCQIAELFFIFFLKKNIYYLLINQNI